MTPESKKELTQLLLAVFCLVAIATTIGLAIRQHELNQNRDLQTCLDNKYIGVVYIENSPYCYRAIDGIGNLIRLDLLPEKALFSR